MNTVQEECCTMRPHFLLLVVHSISQQEYSSKANKGENNGRAKLTENDVREIRKLYEIDKKTIKEISEMLPNRSFCAVKNKIKLIKILRE